MGYWTKSVNIGVWVTVFWAVIMVRLLSLGEPR